MNMQEFTQMCSVGKDPTETAEAFMDKLRCCFIISDRGESKYHKRQFYRENVEWKSSIIPRAISSLSPEVLPNELSKFYLENLLILWHYIEQVIMQLPGQKVMDSRGHLVLPEKNLDVWAKTHDEFYLPPELQLVDKVD